MEEGKMPRVSSDEEFGLDSSDTTATDEVEYNNCFQELTIVCVLVYIIVRVLYYRPMTWMN